MAKFRAIRNTEPGSPVQLLFRLRAREGTLATPNEPSCDERESIWQRRGLHRPAGFVQGGGTAFKSAGPGTLESGVDLASRSPLPACHRKGPGACGLVSSIQPGAAVQCQGQDPSRNNERGTIPGPGGIHAGVQRVQRSNGRGHSIRATLTITWNCLRITLVPLQC